MLLYTTVGILVLAVLVVFGGEATLSTDCLLHFVSFHVLPREGVAANRIITDPMGADPGCKDCHIPQGLENFHLALQTHIVDGSAGAVSRTYRGLLRA